MTDKLLKPFESAINFALSLDKENQAKIAVLQGHLFQLECLSPEFSVFASIIVEDSDIRVKLTNQEDRQADVVLSGTAAAFLSMLQKGMGMGAISSSNIRISGDIEAGQRIQKIMQDLELDWEALIATYIGDFPARKIGNFMRETLSFVKQSKEYGEENIADYLSEEKKIMVPLAEFEVFEEELDELRAKVDRLQARLSKLIHEM